MKPHKSLSISWLRSNGYPRIGKIICNKGRVKVYSYGGHKVVRICTASVDLKYELEQIKMDNLKALHLMKSPHPSAPKIFRSNIINNSHIVVMRKYKMYDYTSYFRDVEPKVKAVTNIKIPIRGLYDQRIFWDVHRGNVGYYPKLKKSPVVFDIWSSVGGDKKKNAGNRKVW